MFPAKYLLLAVTLLLLSVFEVSSGDDVNPSKCDPSCQQLPPPYPPLSYGAPPPPSSGGYAIYSAPPPPHHSAAGQSKCPPGGTVVQCCTPPATYTYAPPNPYTYVPYVEGGASASRLLLPILVPIMMFFSCFIFLF